MSRDGTSNEVDVRLLSRGAPQGLATGAESVSIGTTYEYVKGEVAEFISNPSNYLEREFIDIDDDSKSGQLKDVMINEIRDNTKEMLVDNHAISKFMPAGSIRVFVRSQLSNSPAGVSSVIAYPFFPPHLSLPLKPGETVWLLSETKGDVVFYYWMCRVVGDRQLDDLNYTNLDRNSEIRILNKKHVSSGKNVTDPTYLVPASQNVKNSRGILPRGVNLNNIHATSIAWMEEHVSEPIPRTFRKCSDMVIQGSNNSTLQLTTEKFRSLEDIASEVFLNKDSKKSDAFIHTPMAGAVDLFVGKEKERLVALSATDKPESLSSAGSFNTRMSSRIQGGEGLESYELDKLDQFTIGEENQNEGLDNPRNVFARLYMGMNSSPDESFQLSNADFSNAHHVGGSATLYAHHSRIFAEESLRMYNYSGNSIFDMSDDGTITIQSGEGSTAAKIILRPDGNIIIKPGSGGNLYLGGDESQDSGVAVSINTATSPVAGQTQPFNEAVSAQGGGLTSGIMTTFGGVAFSNDPVGGFSSSKVLITK